MTAAAATANFEPSARAPASVGADTLAGSLMLMLALTVVQRGLGFVREVLFCRWLDQDQLGQWALAYAFLTSGAAIAALGIQGSMSRYVEFYRQRGQLRGYLRRVMGCTAALTLIGTAVVGLAPQSWSQFVFGRSDRASLVPALALALAVVLANNFLIEYFAALRLFRAVSILHCANGVGFVVFGLGAAVFAGPSAENVILAFTFSYVVAGAVLGLYAAAVWRKLPLDSAAIERRTFWPKVLTAGLGLWIYNCLSNLMDTVDRYMIVHFSGLDAAEALAAVGNYHSARVVPVLLYTIAVLVSSTVMPHWSHDWESGRRDKVAGQLRLTVKLAGGGLFALALVVLVAAPWIFGIAFQDKYSGGRAVLPYVLANCIWAGLAVLAFNYLWCAERLRLVTLAMGIAVAVNIGLNLLLTPRHGLQGAVIAVGGANLVLLSLAWRFSRHFGLEWDGGMGLVILAPMTLIVGIPAAAAAAIFAVLLVGTTDRVLTAVEKEQLGRFWTSLQQRFQLWHGGSAKKRNLTTRH
jgi:O-antigen/teichoic acid export membrane protein